MIQQRKLGESVRVCIIRGGLWRVVVEGLAKWLQDASAESNCRLGREIM
jgi:hypothetical protein